LLAGRGGVWGRARERRARVRTLTVRDASGAERVLPLGQDVITIGRAADCTIRLDNPYVSRQHARIEARDDRLLFVDLGSHNGSLYNGARVNEPVWLSPGDLVTIAGTTIRYIEERSADDVTRTFMLQTAQPPIADVLRVDSQTHEVWIGGEPFRQRLSAQEFGLLSYLYEQRHRVCMRRELGDAIWGAYNWDVNMLHRLVHRLKEKVEPDPERPRYVQTVPGVGYRITA
jgi:pSer/pThr/pTyr-binding forkhead associated (FHA) protein